jgi:hypothetical protein
LISLLFSFCLEITGVSLPLSVSSRLPGYLGTSPKDPTLIKSGDLFPGLGKCESFRLTAGVSLAFESKNTVSGCVSSWF